MLLDRGGHGASELRFIVEQRIIPGGHGGINSRLQISQPTQRANDPPADLLDHVGDVGIGWRLDLDKARLEARLGAIEIDARREDNVIMDI